MTGPTLRPRVPAGPVLAASLALALALSAARTIHEAPAAMRDHGPHALMAPPAAPDADGAPARPATIVRPLSCTPLPDVPGSSVTTALVEFPPGARTGPHRHPGSVTAFVISGTVRSQMAGGPAQDYTKGQTWFEAPQALHLFAENPSPTAPAILLATFITDDGCTKLVIPEPH
ncbi:MAG TPA: cupin domain-containing protein [Burkholderiaceae bacterium]